MKTNILILALAFLTALPALAVQDVPLAVTTLAHPSLRETPTAAQLKKSQSYLERGLKALSKQDYTRALEDFKDSVKIAPGADNYKALGTAYYQVNDKAKAAWAYRQSIQLRPDNEVQALVDSLEGRDDPKEIFKDKHDELRYAKLLKEGREFEKQGKLDSAMGRFRQANELHPGPAAREHYGRAVIELVEEAVASKNYAKGKKLVGELGDAYRDAKDLSRREENYLSRLDKAESSLAVAAGEKARELEKAGQTDKERFERDMQKKGKPKVKIDIQ